MPKDGDWRLATAPRVSTTEQNLGDVDRLPNRQRFPRNPLGDCLSRIHPITLPAEYWRGDPPQVATKNLMALGTGEIGVKDL